MTPRMGESASNVEKLGTLLRTVSTRTIGMEVVIRLIQRWSLFLERPC